MHLIAICSWLFAYLFYFVFREPFQHLAMKKRRILALLAHCQFFMCLLLISITSLSNISINEIKYSHTHSKLCIPKMKNCIRSTMNQFSAVTEAEYLPILKYYWGVQIIFHFITCGKVTVELLSLYLFSLVITSVMMIQEDFQEIHFLPRLGTFYTKTEQTRTDSASKITAIVTHSEVSFFVQNRVEIKWVWIIVKVFS